MRYGNIDQGLVYGYCDVCDKRGDVKEFRQLTGKVVRLCLKCLGPGYHQLVRKKTHGKARRKEGDKPHPPFRHTQVD